MYELSQVELCYLHDCCYINNTDWYQPELFYTNL